MLSTPSGRDVYHLTWPFLVWGSLILLSYAISLSALSGLSGDLINIKLFQRSHGQASRVTFYANGVFCIIDVHLYCINVQMLSYKSIMV